MKLVSYNRDVKQIVDCDGNVIAMLLRFTNNKWGVFDTNEVRLTKLSFEDAKAAFAFYKTIA